MLVFFLLLLLRFLFRLSSLNKSNDCVIDFPLNVFDLFVLVFLPSRILHPVSGVFFSLSLFLSLSLSRLFGSRCRRLYRPIKVSAEKVNKKYFCKNEELPLSVEFDAKSNECDKFTIYERKIGINYSKPFSSYHLFLFERLR